MHPAASNMGLTLPLDEVKAYKALVRLEVARMREKYNTYLTFKDILSEIKKIDNMRASRIAENLIKKGLIIKVGDDTYTTMHAELIRKLVNLSLKPGDINVYEWKILGPRETPLPDFNAYKFSDIDSILYSYFTRKGLDSNLAKCASLAIVEALELTLGKNKGLSRYQHEMIRHALTREWPLVMVLSAPTGSGKTIVFMIVAVAYILAKELLGKNINDKPYVLLVYPRKALATDQLRRFVKLLYHVNAALERHGIDQVKIDVGILDGDSPHSLSDTISEDVSKTRNYVRGLNNLSVAKDDKSGYLSCEYSMEYGRTVCYVDGDKLDYRLVTDVRCEILERKPAILITNIWMLERYIIHRDYPSKNFKSICSSAKHGLNDVLFNAKLIIIDEAHVYRNFQQIAIASLVHRYLVELALRRTNINFDNYDAIDNAMKALMKDDLGIILSSATITTIDEGCKSKKDPKIRRLFKDDMENFVKYILSPGVYSRLGGSKSLVAENYDCVESHSNDSRLNIVVILAPRPGKASSTIQQEALLATLAWSLSFKNKIGKPLKFISFFDNKDDLVRIYDWLVNVIIRDRCEHCDHLGMPDFSTLNPPCGQLAVQRHSTSAVKNLWKKYLSAIIENEIGINGVNTLNDAQLQKIDLDMLMKALYDRHEFWLTFPYMSKRHQNVVSLLNDLHSLTLAICQGQNVVKQHHADLNRHERLNIEEMFRNGSLVGLLATQTLELGIDIDDVGVVIQYKPPRRAESFVQRIGRAGRKPSSFYITLGILILTSLDTIYLSEEHANKLLFEVRPEEPPYKNHNMLLSVTLRYILYALSRYSDESRKLLRRVMKPTRKPLDSKGSLIKYLEKYRLNEYFEKLINILNDKKFKQLVTGLIYDMYNDVISYDIINNVYSEIINDLNNIFKIQIKKEYIIDIENILASLFARLELYKGKCIEGLSSNPLVQLVSDLLNEFSSEIYECVRRRADNFVKRCLSGEEEYCIALNKLKDNIEKIINLKISDGVLLKAKIDICRCRNNGALSRLETICKACNDCCDIARILMVFCGRKSSYTS